MEYASAPESPTVPNSRSSRSLYDDSDSQWTDHVNDPLDTLGGRACVTPQPKDLIELIEYSYQQVATSFPEVDLERTPKLSVLGLEQFSGWVTDRELLPGVRTSEDKVHRKDMCWSVRVVYVLKSCQM